MPFLTKLVKLRGLRTVSEMGKSWGVREGVGPPSRPCLVTCFFVPTEVGGPTETDECDVGRQCVALPGIWIVSTATAL